MLPASEPAGWAALVVLMLPVLLVSVDNTVLSFALPEISIALAPTGAEQLWIIDVYPLVLAGLLVTMGTLGDRFGRRRMLLIGATGFAAVSALAAFAPTAGLLIAARALLGFFGAMLMPSTLSLLRSIFQKPATSAGMAIAVWASAFSAGSALGPIVGGILLEHFAWGSVFLIAVPVLIPLLIAAPLLVPESRDPNPGRIDLISIALSMATMIPVVYAIKSLAVDGPEPHGRRVGTARLRDGLPVRPSPAAGEEPDARHGAVPSRFVLRSDPGLNPAQCRRTRRLPLLRVAAPAARPRAVTDDGRFRTGPRHARDDRRRALGRAGLASSAAAHRHPRRAGVLGGRIPHRGVHDA